MTMLLVQAPTATGSVEWVLVADANRPPGLWLKVYSPFDRVALASSAHDRSFCRRVEGHDGCT
jgi:hypothetical protein